jgi:hypothetical protein
MTRFTFVIALCLGLTACTGCGNDSSNKDGSAAAQDAGNNDADSQD